MYKLDTTKNYREGRPSRTPFKPYILRRGRGNFRGGGNFNRGRIENRFRNRSQSRDRDRGNWQGQRGRGGFGRGFNRSRRRGRSFQRSNSYGRGPFHERQRSWSRDRNIGNRGRSPMRQNSRGRSPPKQRVGRDDNRCFHCHEFGHWKGECPLILKKKENLKTARTSTSDSDSEMSEEDFSQIQGMDLLQNQYTVLDQPSTSEENILQQLNI